MQSVSSRIWTRIAVFISYGDNDYTTGICQWCFHMYVYICLYTRAIVCDYTIICEQTMVNVKLNCFQRAITTPRKILISNGIASEYQYLEAFNCVQTNELWLV